MKSKRDYKVEYKTEYVSTDLRWVYYRVVPSELPLLKRIFRNPWKRMFHPHSGGWPGFKMVYRPQEFLNEVSPLKTLGEVEDYLSRNRAEIESIREEGIRNGTIWPD